MAVTFTAAKALLAAQATELSAQATTAGLTALATALTNLASEISGNSLTEREFFGGGTGTTTYPGSGSHTDWDSAALVWANTITSAAQVIKTKIANDMAADLNDMAADLDEIKTDVDTIATKQTTLAEKTTDIRDYQLAIKNWMDEDGIHVKSPWEYLGAYSLIKFYEEKGWSLAEAKTRVEATLKHRD